MEAALKFNLAPTRNFSRKPPIPPINVANFRFLLLVLGLKQRLRGLRLLL